MKNLSGLPQLNVSDTPTIGFPMAGVNSETLFNSIDETQLRIANDIQLMREILEQQSRLIVDIYTRVYTPWYSRLWNWIRRGF